jgi:primosomal protein N' (replication factor Y)
MIYHRTDNNLHCHYCKTVENIIHICSECASKNLECLGAGTQRVEETLKDEFPGIRILRMDMDTMRKRGAHEKILQEFHDAKADVLLGTQMIAKGLDFENVTLVGVINADSGLFFPDFRAGERVFQLIYQVAGRAGRRKKPGEVIIQTYNPDDIYIQTAASLDTKKFYNIAMAQRQELNYPPFSRIGRIVFSGSDKNRVNSIAKKTFQKLDGNPDYKILGPTSAPREKIKDMWRSHLIIKTQNKKKGSLHQFLYNNIDFSIFERNKQGVRIQVDIDPISMM